MRIHTSRSGSAKYSKEESTGLHQELRLISKPKVPLILSTKLQTQINLLCSRINDTEWSGVLFYKTEGDFGQPNFKVLAQELFLMDIGSSAFTQYTMADPSLARLMMTRPEILDMSIGHIHSHHRMAVFFSGTDDQELVDNSEFHSYYVSLIVNNSGDMQAKIAFRGEIKEQIKRTVSYYDNSELVPIEGDPIENARKGLFYFDCEIQAEEAGSEFESRFLEVQRSILDREKKEKEARKGHRSFRYEDRDADTSPVYQTAGRPAELFTSPGRSYVADDPVENASYSRDIDEDSLARIPRGEFYSFLSKLVTLNPLYEHRLSEGMKEAATYENNVTKYVDDVKNMIYRQYIASFPQDRKMERFDEVASECQNIMELYENEYPAISRAVRTVLIASIEEEK